MQSPKDGEYTRLQMGLRACRILLVVVHAVWLCCCDMARHRREQQCQGMKQREGAGVLTVLVFLPHHVIKCVVVSIAFLQTRTPSHS